MKMLLQSNAAFQLYLFFSLFAAKFLKSLVRARIFWAEIKEMSQLTDDIIKQKLQDINGRSISVYVEIAIADLSAM